MKVAAKIKMDVDLRDLAAAMAGSPVEFAHFWFLFAEIVRKEKIDMEPFGKAMAPSNGSIRQEPLVAVIDHMRHYSRKEQ